MHQDHSGKSGGEQRAPVRQEAIFDVKMSTRVNKKELVSSVFRQCFVNVSSMFRQKSIYRRVAGLHIPFL